MKCLYNDQLMKNGYQVIKTIRVANLEKQRVKDLHKANAPEADTFQVQQNGELKRVNNKPVLSADSVAYYNSVLSQADFFDKHLLLTTDSLVSVNDKGAKSLFFTGRIYIIYKNEKGQYNQSEINLVTPMPVQIEKNGSYYPPQEILANGYWAAYEKVANELPVDYTTTDD
jgi:hypothetical protein